MVRDATRGLVLSRRANRRYNSGPMDLHVTLDRRPQRAQLERQLRDGVRSGRLRPGTRLPADAARWPRELGVSRGVVVEAYAQLVAEGYLAARRGAGTRVARRQATSRTGPTPRPTRRSRGLARVPNSVGFDLRTGRPDLSAFPRAAWHAAPRAGAARRCPTPRSTTATRAGTRPLREALAEHLGRARGVLADPEHVVVCGGLYPGLPSCWRALRAARRAAGRDGGPGLARAAAGGRAGRARGGARAASTSTGSSSRRSATPTRSSSRPRTSSRPASCSRPSGARSSSPGRASATR